MKQSNKTKWIINIATVVGTILTIAFIIYGIKNNIFTSEEALSGFLTKVGIWGPIIFIIIQLVQVIIPIIPGGISCAVGVLVFGPYYGFVYNYLSICAGSIIVFLLARRFGMPFIRKLFKEETITKYEEWLDKGNKFDMFFALAILMPVAPDDFLCYFAGLTKMSLKKFTAIIILCKPATILAYSMGLVYLTQLFFK